MDCSAFLWKLAVPRLRVNPAERLLLRMNSLHEVCYHLLSEDLISFFDNFADLEQAFKRMCACL